jgi:hypothetical protein
VPDLNCGPQVFPSLNFDPPPKFVYFGLDAIIAMVESAMARAAVQHGN